MIEIILREDIANYETKPIFGMTYRQVAAIAVAVIADYLLWNGLVMIGFPEFLVAVLCMLVGIGVALFFLVKVKGMYASQRLPILVKYYERPKTVFTQNRVFNKPRVEIKKTKEEIKEIKKLKKESKKETEFIN